MRIAIIKKEVADARFHVFCVYKYRLSIIKYKESEKEFIVTLFNGSSIFCIILQR